MAFDQGKIAQEYIGPSPTPSFSDVVFQCNFDGANGDTTAKDESYVNAAISFNGTAQLSTTQMFGGTSSLRIDGSNGCYCSTVWNPAYDRLCGGDFTYEFFYRPDSMENNGYGVLVTSSMFVFFDGLYIGVIFTDINGINHWLFISPNDNGILANNFQFCSTPTEQMFGSTKFYHIAVCRYKSTLRLFIDGQLAQFSYNQTRSNTEQAVSFLAPTKDQQFPFIGFTDGTQGIYIAQPLNYFPHYNLSGSNLHTAPCYIDSVRISACAWYREDSFTPPTSPFIPVVNPSHFIDSDSFYEPFFDPHTLRPYIWRETDIFGRNPQSASGNIDVNGPNFTTPPNDNSGNDQRGYANGFSINYGGGFDRTGSNGGIVNWDGYVNFDYGDGTFDPSSGNANPYRPADTLLIATTLINAPNQIVSTSNGWTIGGTHTDGSIATSAWAWRIATRKNINDNIFSGSSLDWPDFTWQSAAQSYLTWAEFIGYNYASPTGNYSMGDGTTLGVSLSGVVNSSSSESIIYGAIHAVFTGSVAQGYNPFQANAATVPTNYLTVQLPSTHYGMSQQSFYQRTLHGVTSDNVSATFSSIPFPSLFSWHAMLIEIKDVGP
jgi:hypothetical protein